MQFVWLDHEDVAFGGPKFDMLTRVEVIHNNVYFAGNNEKNLNGVLMIMLPPNLIRRGFNEVNFCPTLTRNSPKTASCVVHPCVGRQSFHHTPPSAFSRAKPSETELK